MVMKKQGETIMTSQQMFKLFFAPDLDHLGVMRWVRIPEANLSSSTLITWIWMNDDDDDDDDSRGNKALTFKTMTIQSF